MVGSGAKLDQAITAAQAVANDANATLQQLQDAKADLDAAVTAYNNAVVKDLANLDGSPVTVAVGATDNSKSITPAPGETLDAESDDTAIATVAINPDGETVEITGVAAGTANVTVVTRNADGSVLYTRTIVVTVQ